MNKPRIPALILFLIAGFLLITCFSMMAEVFFPVDMGKTFLLDRLKPPSFLKGGTPKFFLGTDSLGRDFVVRLVYATKTSLSIAFASMLILLAISLFQEYVGDWRAKLAERSLPFRWLVYICAINAVIIFGVYGIEYDASKFIYFQF